MYDMYDVVCEQNTVDARVGQHAAAAMEITATGN